MKILKRKVATKKLIRHYFRPFTGVIKKNERTLKIIEKITNFKSKELQYVTRVIFDEDTSNSKLSDSELTHIITRMKHLQDNLTFGKLHKKGLPVKMTIPRLYYLEFKSGFKKDSKELEFLIGRYFKRHESGMDKIQKIRDSKNETNSQKFKMLGKIMKERSEVLSFIDMWHKILEKNLQKNSKTMNLPEKINVKMGGLSNSKLDASRENLEKESVEVTNKILVIEDKILNLNNLGKSCTNCYQKVTNPYKKKQIKSYKKTKKELLISKNTLGIMLSVNDRLKFVQSNMDYRSFKEAKKFVQSLKLNSKNEWEQYLHRNELVPADIPTSPDVVYGPNFDPNTKEKWTSWGDWLGTGKIEKYRTFKEAREFAHKSKIKSMSEWRKLSNAGMLPADIPKNPERVYKKQWKGYQDMFTKGFDQDNLFAKRVKRRKGNTLKNPLLD